MLDKFLHFLDRNLHRLPVRSFRLEKHIYYLICHRRQERRWNAAVAAHKAAGGVVITHSWNGGETQTLVGGGA